MFSCICWLIRKSLLSPLLVRCNNWISLSMYQSDLLYLYIFRSGELSIEIWILSPAALGEIQPVLTKMRAPTKLLGHFSFLLISIQSKGFVENFALPRKRFDCFCWWISYLLYAIWKYFLNTRVLTNIQCKIEILLFFVAKLFGMFLWKA